MKKIAITLLALSALSCSSSNSALISAEHVRTNIELKVNIFKNKNTLNSALRKEYPKDKRKVEGFAVWYESEDNYCEIFVVSPMSEADINTWGHELAHCVYGKWHK